MCSFPRLAPLVDGPVKVAFASKAPESGAQGPVAHAVCVNFPIVRILRARRVEARVGPEPLALLFALQHEGQQRRVIEVGVDRNPSCHDPRQLRKSSGPDDRNIGSMAAHHGAVFPDSRNACPGRLVENVKIEPVVPFLFHQMAIEQFQLRGHIRAALSGSPDFKQRTVHPRGGGSGGEPFLRCGVKCVPVRDPPVVDVLFENRAPWQRHVRREAVAQRPMRRCLPHLKPFFFPVIGFSLPRFGADDCGKRGAFGQTGLVNPHRDGQVDLFSRG